MGVNEGPVRWCDKHGQQLNRVAREFRKRPKRTKKTVKAPPAVPAEGDALGRLPTAVRLKRLTDHIAAASGPVSRKEAARVIGLASVDGSLVRILKQARELGLIKTVRGPDGGLVPGPKATAQIAP